MLGFLSDLKIAFRRLIRQPGFSLMVVGMLGLGIAGNTAIFSIFNGLFMKPLPFHESERLVDIDETAPIWNLEFVGISYPDFHAWREQNRTFEGMAVWDQQSFNLSAQGAAERIEGARVTHDLASVLDIQPVLGRDFQPEDDRPGAAKVALLGFGLWQRTFGGAPDVLGETLRLDSEPYTVVGVLPPEAVIPDDAQLWIPLAADPHTHQGWFLNGVGRLRNGVTPNRAREDLTRVHRAMLETRPDNENTSPIVLPLRERYLGDYRRLTSLLQGAVGVILLIACANVAGLMLARGTARSGEIGIRAALGATRLRIVRELMAESLVLAACGGLLGLILGDWALAGLVSLMPDELPGWVSFEIDTPFLVFCLFVTVFAALLSGLAPALQAARSIAHEALRQRTAGSSTPSGRGRGLHAVVIGEIALALVLLVGAALVVRAFLEVQKVETGFRPDNVLTFRVDLPRAKYVNSERRISFFTELLERCRALPGVQAAGAITSPPLAGHWGDFFEVENARPLGPDEQDPVTLVRVITPGYLQAMGVTLTSGRPFTEHDGRTEGAPTVIVNETFARTFWPGADPLGKRIRYREEGSPWLTVVGVTHDVKHYGLDVKMRPGVYVPFLQTPVSTLAVILRGGSDPSNLVSPAREIVREMDADLPLHEVVTMSQRIDDSLWIRRSYSSLFGLFAAVALVLACGGLYGVISHAVGQRTHEIGIRMALGAREGQVLRQVLGRGLALVSMGILLGLAGAFWASGLLETLLFGISGSDPITYIVVSLILMGVAFLAMLLPARRAARVDPIRALHVE
jgi:putative ABC transport system permease protein